MGGPIGRKAIKKEQHDSSPPVAEFEGPQSHLVRQANAQAISFAVLVITLPCKHCLTNPIDFQLALPYSRACIQVSLEMHAGSWCW